MVRSRGKVRQPWQGVRRKDASFPVDLSRTAKLTVRGARHLAIPQARPNMEHIYHIDDRVHHWHHGPQGRDVVEPSPVYTILALMPVEADGRPRYRIKSK